VHTPNGRPIRWKEIPESKAHYRSGAGTEAAIECVPMNRLCHPPQVRTVLVSITVAFIGVCLSLGARGAGPLVRTVCEVLEHRDSYNGQLIRVSGTATSDGLERSIIQDASCPKVGIALRYSAAGAKTAAARRLKEALFPGLGTYEQVEKVEATLVGTFLFDAAEHQVPTLVIDQVSDLSVILAPQPTPK